MNKNALNALIFSLLCSQSVSASEEDIDDIFEMSMEALLQVKVKSTSKKEELINNSPGVISVITAEQIRELGAQRIDDVLKTIPGVFSFENYFSLNQQYSFRGNLSENHNSKVLFLINGHPSFHTLSSGFFTDMVPIEAIEKIEVVRGPVSVLYGTNALTGVINIITKQDLGERSVELKLQAASFSTFEAKINAASQWDNGHFFLSGALKKQDGFELNISPEQDFETWTGYAGDGGLTNNFDEHSQLFVQVGLDNFEMDIAYFEQEKTSKYGIMPSLFFRVSPFDTEIVETDIRYQMQASENLKLRYALRFDDYSYDYRVDNYQWLDGGPTDSYREGVGGFTGHKYGAELIADYNFTNGEIISGFSWDEYRGDKVIFKTGEWQPFILVPKKSANRDAAIYTNARYKVLQGELEYIAGARYTDNKMSGGHTDYRLGLIWHKTEYTTFKLLWGTSYRSANFLELGEDAPPVIQGNSELDVEVLEGLDLVMVNHGENYLLNLNLFWNETDDEIFTRPDENGISTFTNILGKRTSGVEFDITFFPSDDIKMFLRGSHLFKVKDIETSRNISQQTMTNNYSLGLNWQLTEEFKFDFTMIDSGKWLEAKSYQLANAGIRYQPNFNRALEIFLLGHNIFNTDYDIAQWQDWEVSTMPGGPPRSWTLGFQYRW